MYHIMLNAPLLEGEMLRLKGLGIALRKIEKLV